MNEFNAFRLITGLFPPSFFGTRNKLLRNWLSFEWTRWMAPFLSIACTSWVINSDTCIEIWAWCGTPSWNGSSWNLKWFLPILNSDTHSNIFGSFARIFQFSKKYCSQVESFLFPLSEKDLVPKDARFNWYIGTISGKCVFGRREVVLRKVSFFLEETLTKWSLTPWWLRPLRCLGWWFWLTSTVLRRCKWYKSFPILLLQWEVLSKRAFVTVTHTNLLIYFLVLFLCLSCNYHVLVKWLAKKFFGNIFEKRALVFKSVFAFTFSIPLLSIHSYACCRTKN